VGIDTERKPKLNADETMLFLIVKGHEYISVPFGDLRPGSFAYVQACCDYRKFRNLPRVEGLHAEVLSLYLDGVCVKLMNADEWRALVMQIYERLSSAENLAIKDAFDSYVLAELVFYRLRLRRVDNLQMDESLVKHD
jgi:hypothetical protein